MKVLIVTKAPWDDRIASGNTLSNLFSGWQDVEFACIYCRDSSPYNSCCNLYYSVSPINILKNILTPWRIGRRFRFEKTMSQMIADSKESALIEKARGHRSFYNILNELLYSSYIWFNGKLKNFISDFNPDIVFCFGVPDPLNVACVKYIYKNVKAPIVSYFVDDLYSAPQSGAHLFRKIIKKRLNVIAGMSTKCYGISDLLCEEYSKHFGRPFDLLFKGCEISSVKTKVGHPISFMYAGNLLYGRAKTLACLAQIIERVNEGKRLAKLDLYSGTKVTDEIRADLNIDGSSTLHPAREYSEIKKLMNEADIVLHVESFDEKEKEVVRLSFSTKITDCMQSGSMMIAIGPRGVSSIEYPNKVPGTLVISNPDDIEKEIIKLVENPDLIIENAELSNTFAKQNIEINTVRTRLINTFNEIIHV